MIDRVAGGEQVRKLIIDAAASVFGRTAQQSIAVAANSTATFQFATPTPEVFQWAAQLAARPGLAKN